VITAADTGMGGAAQEIGLSVSGTSKMVVSSFASLTAVWSVRAKDAASMIAALQLLQRNTRTQPGCEACQFTTEIGDIVLIRYLEKWDSEPSMQRQVRSGRFATLAELFELAIERPTVEFEVGGVVRGLDYADDVRGTRH
jgi:quinol monooxygenase YgiN